MSQLTLTSFTLSVQTGVVISEINNFWYHCNQFIFKGKIFVKIDSLAVVTLQAFTRGKSFYLGKISLGKCTSGFIFPRIKGHTGDHWTFGGLTSQRIKF